MRADNDFSAKRQDNSANRRSAALPRVILDVRMKKTVALAGAWLPFFVLWLLFGIQMGTPWRRALPFAFYAIATAALLGLAVSKLCARVPLQLRPRFYAVHFASAALYAAVWSAVVMLFEARVISRAQFVGFFLEGVWIYAIVAGASYAFHMQRSLAVARLDALRSRLRPHFLFNALHTVGALVRHDPAEAESAVEKLGDMLRYTLREGEEDAVPFAEEWEFTRQYLEFEQLRYGDRLRVRADIDPRSLQCSAPSFALQTLVENAVHHFIDTRAEGGEIEISVRADDATLRVRVRDDGGNGSQGTGNKFGLASLRERLHTVYGTELNVRNDNGFEVSFTIPCE